MIGSVQEGRYRIVRKLGEGGQGEVYLVEHLHLERAEALKVLKAKYARDDNFVSRFRREARATNRVQHPNIVGVYDFGRLSDGRYFLAMEYVDGVRLDQAIGDGPMPVRRAVRIAGQLARALAHAHGLGVVHRDLKPANLILVTHRGQVDFLKVLDFGMAKIVEADGDAAEGLGRTFDGQMFGTGPYMAPEQFLERGADPRMDVYGTGCILYEMLTGAPPFTGGMVQLMDQHMRVPVPPPSRRVTAGPIPPALDLLVLRALAKRPDDRFGDAGALADALDAIAVAAAPVDRGSRRTRTGVVVPRPIDDFGGDTEGDGAPITETGAEPDPGQSAPTERMSPDDAIEVAGALIHEIGDSLLDRGTTEVMLVAGMAQLRDLRSQLSRIRGEVREVETRADALEQSFREREASLSFAIGELTFDRDQAGPAGVDVAVQIDQLERSLAALHTASKQQLAVLDDQALGLAATLHDAEEAHEATCHRLVGVMTPIIDRGGAEPDAVRLRQRLATVRALFEVK